MKNMKKQHGISLLEVLLSLTIIAIILVMAVRYYFVADESNRINVTREEVGELVDAVHAWKGNNAEYDTSLDIKTLYNQGFLPNSKNLKTNVQNNKPPVTSATLYDPWGQAINLTVTSNGATIQLKLPTQNDCMRLNTSYPNGACDGNGGFTLNFV